jgi:glutamyl-tRNA synthetase
MSQNNQSVRVRFAPSPTGPLHIGGVRTALYNYLFAKKHGGTFILRIEDTDQTRFTEGAESYIEETLEWCGMLPNESTKLGGNFGPYKQSDRKSMYKQYAEQLLESGKAYYAFDTSEELDAMREAAKAAGSVAKYGIASRGQMKNSLALSAEEVEQRLAAGENYVIRLKVNAGETIVFEDMVRGLVRFQSDEIDDKILLKSDGMPTYHLANIVDDHLMEISHVIRGEEWLPSTPLHVLLYRYLGWEDTMPMFAHLPLILKPVGSGKLSKRDGDKHGFPVFPLDWKNPTTGETAMGFRERGFLPQAVVNFLAFLGWNPGTEQELFSMEELIENFSLDRVNKAGARFNFDKAKWFNQQYIIQSSDADLAKMVRPQVAANGHTVEDAALETICGLLNERMTTLSDFWEQGYYFFEDVKEYDKKTVKKKWKLEKRPIFDTLVETISNIELFTGENIETEVKAYINDNELGFGNVLPIFRVALTGTMKGPSIFDVAALLGKEVVLKRFETAFAAFDASKQA